MLAGIFQEQVKHKVFISARVELNLFSSDYKPEHFTSSIFLTLHCFPCVFFFSCEKKTFLLQRFLGLKKTCV